MKTIKMKMTLFFGTLILIICLGVGYISFRASRTVLIESTEHSMSQLALEASQAVEAGISKYSDSLEVVAANELFYNIEDTKEYDLEAEKILQREKERAGYLYMALVNKEGEGIYEDGGHADLSGTDYIKKGLTGERVVTEPMILKDNQVVMVYAVPVFGDGEVSGLLIGIRDGYELGKLAGQITYGESGTAYILNRSGNTIAHSDKNKLQSVLNQITVKEASDTENTENGVSSATQWADGVSSASVASGQEGKNLLGFENFEIVQKDMADGKAGFGEYQYNGESKYMGYAPISDRGWSFALEINKSEVLSGLNKLRDSFILITLLSLLVSFTVVYIIANEINKPIEYLTGICHEMAEGNFTRELEDKYKKRKDEMGRLSVAFQTISGFFRKLLHENAQISGNIYSTSQNLDHMIEQSLIMIKEAAGTIEQIADGSHQQAEDTGAGAEKISEMEELIKQEQDNMQGLKNSADSVEQIKEEGFAILKELVEKTKANSSISKEIYGVILDTHESARKIEKISNMIGGIAKQTNLLALNAAIEAARSGEAGKGFSVVAEEVRVLAEAANRLSKEIAGIINELSEKASGSADKMKEVSDIVLQQADSVEMTRLKFENIAYAIEETRKDIQVISQSVQEMGAKKNEVVNVIMNLSAVSEENASGTEAVSVSMQEQSAYMQEILTLSKNLSQMAEQMDAGITRFQF